MRLLRYTVGGFRLYSSSASAMDLSSTSANPVYCVSCASRGLGLEFTRQLLENNNELSQVIALCRTIPHDEENPLLQLRNKYSNRLNIFQVDLESQASIDITGNGKYARNNYLFESI